MAALPVDAKGVYFISATPFTVDGEVDFASTDRLMSFYARSGVTGLTILGMMGEASKLDTDESLAFAKHVIERADKLPVIVGVSGAGFAAMRTLARGVAGVGAAAVMIAPPAQCRTDDQIVGYFRQASEAIGTDIPFVIQDYPLASSVIMSTGVIGRIVEENPACVMLKHEDWPGLEKLSTLRRLMQAKSLRRIPILCGNGGVFLDFELARGADGAMTGYAFPELLVRMCALQAKGDMQGLRALFDISSHSAAHVTVLVRPSYPALLRIRSPRTVVAACSGRWGSTRWNP